MVGGIAAVAAAAVLLARRRDAAQSAAGSPTSGRRDAALPPIVRQLGHAYLQRTTSRRADLPPRLDTPVPSASAPAGAPTPAPAHVRRSARFAVPVGRTPDGGPARVDLAATPALALEGARRNDVARAILLACLNPHAQPDGPLAHVVIPAADAAHLLDDLPSLPTPPGLHIVNHLDTALDELERWPRAGQGSPPLVLIATAPPGQTDPAERLQQILTTKRRHVAAVLLGDWPTPVAIHAGPDAAIHATTAYPILPIATRLFTTPLPDARDLLAALATPPHPTTEQPDRAEPDDPPTAPIPVIESGDPDDQQHDNTDTTEPVPANHDPGDGDDPGSGDHEPDEGDTETTDASADAGRPSGGGLANETDATSNPGEEPATAETHDTDAKQAESPSHPIHPTDPGGGPSSRKALTIEVFGRLQVYVHPDGSDPIDIAGQLSGRRQRELLTYLAVHPDGARRDLLITDLWADNARGNLHSGIRRLRTALAPHAHGEPVILGPEDDHYRFNPAQIDVDYWRFDAASTHHRTARTDTERAEAARQIISIYQSDLAPALSAEWIEPLRAHANRTAIDAADSLARHLYHNGDTDQAVGVLEHATTVIGPYAESLYQLLIQLQRKQGRPKAAARTLEALIDRLAAIDAAPSEATIALARQ